MSLEEERRIGRWGDPEVDGISNSFQLGSQQVSPLVFCAQTHMNWLREVAAGINQLSLGEQKRLQLKTNYRGQTMSLRSSLKGGST